MKTNKTFLPLYITSFFGTLNDNFLKTLASFTVIGWLPDERVKSIAMGVTAGALVLPYILCSPFVPRRRVTMHIEDLTDRVKEWSKLTRLEFNRKLEEWYNDGVILAAKNAKDAKCF